MATTSNAAARPQKEEQKRNLCPCEVYRSTVQPLPGKPKPNRYDKPSALLKRWVDKRSASAMPAATKVDALHLSWIPLLVNSLKPA